MADRDSVRKVRGLPEGSFPGEEGTHPPRKGTRSPRCGTGPGRGGTGDPARGVRTFRRGTTPSRANRPGTTRDRLQPDGGRPAEVCILPSRKPENPPNECGDPGAKRKRDQGTIFGFVCDFAPVLKANGNEGNGKRETGNGKRETGNGKRDQEKGGKGGQGTMSDFSHFTAPAFKEGMNKPILTRFPWPRGQRVALVGCRKKSGRRWDRRFPKTRRSRCPRGRR